MAKIVRMIRLLREGIEKRGVLFIPNALLRPLEASQRGLYGKKKRPTNRRRRKLSEFPKGCGRQR